MDEGFGKKEESILKRIWSDYVTFYWKGRVGYFIVLTAFTAIFIAVEPLFFAKAISLLEETLKKWEMFEIETYGLFLFGWFIFIIFSVLMNFYFNYRVVEVGSLEFLWQKFRQNIVKLLQVKYGDIISLEQWKLYKSFDRGIDSFFSFWEIVISRILLSIIQVLFITIIMLTIHVKMTIIALSIVPFLIWVGIYFKGKTITLQENLEVLWEKVFGKVSDSITNAWLVKFLSLENTFAKRFIKEYDVIEEDQKVVQIRWAFSGVITKMFILCSRLLTLWFGCYYVLGWEISLAVLFLFFAYCSYIYFPIWFIFDSLNDLQQNYTKIKKFYTDIESLNQDINEKENGKKEFWQVEWNIEFINLSFGYLEEKKIFQDLSFSIKQGEKVAFVWNTGAWKSTITSLLFRLWDISSWKILLDGEDIYNYSKQSLRKHIWLVSQDNSLFNTTIKENLEHAFGADIIDVKEKSKRINEALKKAHAHFVFDLKDWVDTVIWERWLKLSWGEKQRLSIARLFIKNPEVLILDEATSALDNKTEKYIQASLDELMKWKTSIIIAHRLTTIQNADRIFMLEEGKIVEAWNYSELMWKKWKFYELASPENLVVW